MVHQRLLFTVPIAIRQTKSLLDVFHLTTSSPKISAGESQGADYCWGVVLRVTVSSSKDITTDSEMINSPPKPKGGKIVMMIAEWPFRR
jgi:hypothetical protein